MGGLEGPKNRHAQAWRRAFALSAAGATGLPLSLIRDAPAPAPALDVDGIGIGTAGTLSAVADATALTLGT